MPIKQETLIRLIKKNKLVSQADLKMARVTASHLGCSVTDVLLGRDLLSEEDWLAILAKHYQVKPINLKKTHVSLQALRLIPETLAVERGVIAFGQKGQQLFLGLEDPGDLELIELVRKTIGTGAKIIPHVATSEGLKEALKLYQKREKKEGFAKIASVKKGTAVTLINQILEDAVRQEASDVHFEPLLKRILVRFRIDGVLHDHLAVAKNFQASLVARIKILADLKLDEQRHPQDGRFSFKTKRKETISLRVASTPTVYGEKVVLRLLKDTLTTMNLEELGLLPEDEKIVGKVLQRTHGMFLVTGPTGSGKTTTLYTVLGLLNNPGVNIMTIEDPVENKIRRINQIQVNARIGLDFAQGLRSVLRQDPDIIMVGEIRDQETAVIAVNAAITGHLVFSTVHANNAAAAIPRMLNLGVEPFLLASSLNAVVAQRLVRVLCPKCQEKLPVSPVLTRRLAQAKSRVSADIRRALITNFKPVGCPSCHYTGFRGRTGIFELVWVDQKIQDLILSKASSFVIWQAARKKGAKTMLEDGLIKVSKGQTTVEEVFRVISE